MLEGYQRRDALGRAAMSAGSAADSHAPQPGPSDAQAVLALTSTVIGLVVG